MIAARVATPTPRCPSRRCARSFARAPRAGVVESIDAYGVGVCAWRLGAGRARKEDPVSPTAGVMTLVRVGDTVEAGQPVVELHADDDAHLARGRDTIEGVVVIGDGPVTRPPLLLDLVGDA